MGFACVCLYWDSVGITIPVQELNCDYLVLKGGDIIILTILTGYVTLYTYY